MAYEKIFERVYKRVFERTFERPVERAFDVGVIARSWAATRENIVA